MVRDWRTAGLSAADEALCAWAESVTRNAHGTTPADLDRLRGHGLDDRAIHDATQVIGYFNYINRVADGLGVDPEAWLVEGYVDGEGGGAGAGGGGSTFR